MLTETHIKCLMAAVIYSGMPPIEDESICEFDVAASMAEDLYNHVVSGSHGPQENTWIAPMDPSDKGN